MEIIKEEIKIKGESPIQFIVRKTHRGPLLDHEDQGAASVLFGSSLPKLKEDKYYSL